MPMSKDDIEEMRSLLAVARKRPVSFGICMGKSPESTVFFLHRMKAPDVLGRQAKKEGDTAKVAFGEANAKGKKLMLTCEGDIPAGGAKRTKQFLSTVGLKLKVVMLDASGNVGDDDGEAEEPDDSVEDSSPEAEVEQGATTGSDSTGSTETTGAAEATGSDEATGSGEAAGSDGAAGSTDADEADEATTETDPIEAKWQALSAALGKLYERAMAFNPANRTQLQAAWTMATEKADGDDFSTAMTIAARLKPALDAVIAAGAGGPKDTGDIPADVVPFQRARLLWIGTRNKMLDEIRKLEDAIIAACAGDEELAPIATEARDLSKRLLGFDDRLQETLEKITVTAAGVDREALKKQALNELRGYATLLGEDFFRDVDTANGFANVAVAATARASLAAIAKTLA